MGRLNWVKCTGPQAQTIQDEAGQHYCCRPAAARALRQRWADIFGANQPADTHVQSFTLKYAQYMDCSGPPPPRSPVSRTDLRASLNKMRGRAAGLDGLCPDHLSALPDAALDLLALLLNECEASGHWPEGLTHWKLVFIPKEDCPCPLLDQVRPIAISSAIYRAWGRARLRNIAEHLSRVMQPWHAGGVKSLDPEVFLVAAEVDFGSARSGPGL